MSELVVNNAMILCSFGSGPMPLTTEPEGESIVKGQSQFAGTVTNSIPMENIKSFIMCNSPGNPAGMGKPIVPTPCPCVPAVAGTWDPPAEKTKINDQPALTNEAKCMCSFGGVISITDPGQVKVMAE